MKLGTLAVLARFVSPEQFGLVAAAQVVVGLADLVADLGLGPSLIQKKSLDDDQISTATTVNVSLGLGLSCLGILFAQELASFSGSELAAPFVQVLSLSFLARALGVTARAQVLRALRFKAATLVEFAAFFVGQVCVAVSLAVAGWGAWSIALGLLAQASVSTGLFLAASPRALRFGLSRSALADLAGNGAGITLAKVANYAALKGDYLIIGRALGMDALGYYNRAYKLLEMPAKLFSKMSNKVVFPSMARVQGQSERLGNAYLRGVSTLATGGLLTSVSFFVLAPELIGVFFGPAWGEAVEPFRWLGLSSYFRLGYKMGGLVCRSTGKIRGYVVSQFFYAAVLLVGTLGFVDSGVVAVARWVGASLVLHFIVLNGLALHILRISPSRFFGAHAAGVVVAVLAGGPLFVATLGLRAAGGSPFVVLSGAAATCATALVLLAIFPPRILVSDVKWWRARVSAVLRRRSGE